jgi:hypothetical protein
MGVERIRANKQTSDSTAEIVADDLVDLADMLDG